MTKLGLVFAITIGALVLNCTSPHPNHAPGGDGGMLGDAHADPGACCMLTPQAFTTIAQGDLSVTSTNPSAVTPPVDVSQYREIIVGATAPNCSVYTEVEFQEPGTTVFINRQVAGRNRVDGPIARGVFSASTCGAVTMHYVIAGVSLN